MWVRAFRLDIGHDLLFNTPLFHLPTQAVAVLQALHGSLSPPFPISLSDLTSTGGQRFSDVSVRVSFGNAVVSVTPEAVSCQFQSVRPEDIEALVDIQERARQAVQNVFPDATYKARRVMLAHWLQCEGGQPAARRAIRSITGQALPGSIGGGTVELPKFHAGISNESEGFASLVDIEDSKVAGAEIFFRLESVFGAEGKLYAVEAARAKINDLVLGTLALMGAHPETDAGAQA